MRFWNLEKEELQRLIWCLVLEEELAHKMGKNRYLGFGSLRLQLLPGSFLTDWVVRYSTEAKKDWRLPISSADWISPKVIQNYKELRSALDARHL